MKDIMILAAGWVFIVLGFLGLFLPVLQGILFLLIGLYLLSRKSPRAKKFLRRLQQRFPALTDKLKEAKEAVKKASRFLRAFGRKS